MIFSTRRLAKLDEQIKSNLEDTIVAETLALRLSDQYSFLQAQANINTWPEEQAKIFKTYQSYGARLDVTGEIVEMKIEGDNARVVLLEILDDEPYHVVWFYQHDNIGWYYVPAKFEYWGETRHL